jgi:hypothetical protein
MHQLLTSSAIIFNPNLEGQRVEAAAQRDQTKKTFTSMYVKCIPVPLDRSANDGEPIGKKAAAYEKQAARTITNRITLIWQKSFKSLWFGPPCPADTVGCH